MPRDIDIALLRAFIAVVDTGGVTTAARLLNRTQAAVSLQIKRLEELLGTELFLREHKKLTLAPAGERLLGSAQRLVALNDDIWGAMTTPDFEGEVRLGVPYDIVTSLIPPVLQRFNQAWPRIHVTLVCKASMLLLEDLDSGEIDLTLTTEVSSRPASETLLSDRLVWVGARGGTTHLQRPLPLSVGCRHCRFRPEVIKALQRAGIAWRVVSEGSQIEASYATMKAGLAVSPLLRTSVPDYLEILGADNGLPFLPDFMINLYPPRSGASAVANELARHIRQDFELRFGPYRPMPPPSRPVERRTQPTAPAAQSSSRRRSGARLAHG
jgi:DNA-binding transcriptional LysR family regulator